MKLYQCHKQVKAKPMTLGEFHAYGEWAMPEDADPNTPGFLVEYLDGGKPNHSNHANYISWSPKDVFERGYTEIPA